jgi:energy-coupling factor transport system permease protein
MAFSYSIYQPLNTPLHRLSPVTKLVITLAITVAVLLTGDIRTPFPLFLQASLLILVVVLLALAHAKIAVLRPFVMGAIFLIPLFSLSWLVFTRQGHPLFHTWGPTDAGTFAAANSALRVLITILASGLLLYTMSETELLQALRRLRIPYIACFTLMLAIRLLPALGEDLDIIRQAQMTRGFELQKGSLLRRARRSAQALIPLIAIAFRRADTLARALESRAFETARGTRRTIYKEDAIHPVDWAILATSAVAIAALVVRQFLG